MLVGVGARERNISRPRKNPHKNSIVCLFVSIKKGALSSRCPWSEQRKSAIKTSHSWNGPRKVSLKTSRSWNGPRKGSLKAHVAGMVLEKVRLLGRMKIRMRRRRISTRLFQMVIVTSVTTMFLYLLFQAGLQRPEPPSPDFSWLGSRNMSSFVRPDEVTVLYEPRPVPCNTPAAEDISPRLLVVVFTAPSHSEARAVIRRTWAKKLVEYPYSKLIFMLGRPKSSELFKVLESEAEEKNDMVMEDFEDAYLNLTLKTTFMLKWINANCNKAKFVFKTDDDVFVNVERLWTALDSSHLYSSLVTITKHGKPTSSNVDYLLLGSVMSSVPIRDPASKWYLPNKFYPLNIFPKFLSGTGYVFTGSLVPALYSCALRTPFINLEDVFLTGLCGTTQLGLRLTHHPEFRWRPMAVGGTHTCFFKQSVTVHKSTPKQLEEMFAKTQDSLLCDTLLFSFMTALSAVLDFFRNLFRM